MSSHSRSSKSPPDPAFLELNAEQQAAVLAHPGPLLILAGAGTGKTRVVACRITHGLRIHPDWDPENILALTFSRKAAEELAGRVESVLGSHAGELPFFTFHGFCYRFLQEHAHSLGLPPRLRLLDSTEAWVFFRKLLPELRLAHTQSRVDPTACIEGFLRFIGRCKDEVVSPDEFQAYAQGLPDSEERSRAEEAARVYRLYQQRMRQSGCLDFGDLVAETLHVLTQRPALLRPIQAKYRAILVDEFQDTNVAQIKLLKRLAGAGEGLCVVGDDDQAIYRFRGASFASFLLLQDAFPSVKTIRLTQNYRSTPEILAVSGGLIRNNEPDRYDPQKQLWTAIPGGSPVEVVVCQDEQEEAAWALERIRLWLGKGPEMSRIGVLYRAHAQREALMEALRRQGIPFSVRGGSILFERPEIKDLWAFLQALYDPSDGVALLRLIGHPAWGIPPEELIALSRWAWDSGRPLREALGRGPRVREDGQALDKGTEAPISEKARAALGRLLSQLARVRKAALREPVERWIPRAVEETFLRLAFTAPSPDGFDPLVSLGRFLRLTNRYAENYPGERDLRAYLGYLDSVQKASATGAWEDEEDPREERVRLMTVHQAKGLEFDGVILLGMVQGRFPARSRVEPIPFPLELMRERLPKGDVHLQEERRLCYVACTRARRELVLMTQERSRHRASVFLREMQAPDPPLQGDSRGQASAAAERISWRPAEPTAGPGPARRAREVPASLEKERELMDLFGRIRSLAPDDEAGFSEAMSEMAGLAASARSTARPKAAAVTGGLSPGSLGEGKFSFSQLSAYRACPLKYVYAYVYRIPVRPMPHLNFGTDLHLCLERFYREILGGRIPSMEELLEGFRVLHAPGRYGEPFQDEEYRRLGGEMLTAFYRKQEGFFGLPIFVEKHFLLPLGEATLHGYVDRADSLPGGGVEIIDYKSGKPKGEASAEEQLQLRLYALAAREVFGLDPRRISFYYLRNNEKLSFDLAPEHMDETRQRVLGLIRQVRSGQFEPTPSEFLCSRCDFRRLCPASAV